jgi:hypothetical protein
MAFNRTAGDRIPARGMAGPGVLGSGHPGAICGISSFPGEQRPEWRCEINVGRGKLLK